MKRRLIVGYICYIMLIINNCCGYYYHLCVLENVSNKEACQKQLVIGLAEFHVKSHPVNDAHRSYIDHVILKKCAAAKGKLIVEDLGSVNNDGKMNCCNFAINSLQGVLGTLANKAREAGILVDNVEYRYCRVAGISPLLNNLGQSPYSFKSAMAITAASLHQEVIDEVEAIKQYNDGKKLNALYKQAALAVGDTLSTIDFCNNKWTTVANYCSCLPRNNYKQELERLCIFDSALIDMKIIHSIASSLQVPLIIVAAGGSHIKEMNEMLKKIGYKSIFSTSQPLCLTIKKGINIHIDRVPQPIDISILDKFIK